VNRITSLQFNLIGVLVICVLVAVISVSLYHQEYGFASVGFAGIITVGTWFYVQYRDHKKMEWEAIQAYYKEIDSDTMVKARREAKRLLNCEADTLSGEELKSRDEAVSMVLNSWEKWGRLVEGGYLPINLFDGSSGDGIADMLCLSHRYILGRRTSGQNKKYAGSMVWLVEKIRDKRYLDHWDKGSLDKLDDCLKVLQLKKIK
jgi:hypothetical protein